MSIDEKNIASRDYTKTLIEATRKNIDEKIETTTKDIDEKIKKSDWNQNDSTENDYIIGRTHWSEEGLIEVLPETTIDFVEEDSLQIEYILSKMLVEGTEYIVTWNDIEYTCLARNDGYNNIYIGNQVLSGGWTFPEVIESLEPFFIATCAPDNWSVIGVANADTYTIKITYWGEIIHKIDNKYLPEMVGKNLEGQFVTFYDPNDDWNEVTVQAARGAEIFNDYEYNVAAGPASHAEGIETMAVSAGAHAENINTLAFDVGSHAEGIGSIALGYASHAEGWETEASGEGAHAEGRHTCAYGWQSHAEGLATIANGRYQHVEGKNNIIDNEDKYLHIAGNGVDSDDEMRSNAHTLDWEGNAWFAGDVYIGSTSGTNKDDGSKRLATIEDLSSASDVSLEDAKAYTDNQINALNVQSIEGLETALTNAEANALADANAYTDGKVTEINTALNGKETAGAAAQALADANAYTDQEIAALVGSAPETLDTIEEISAALNNNKDILTVLTDAIGLKADKATVESEISRIDTALAGKEATGVAEAKANQALSDAKTYTNQQIDALAVASIDGLQDALNLKADKTEIPTAVSALTNDANYTDKDYVDGAIETALGNITSNIQTVRYDNTVYAEQDNQTVFNIGIGSYDASTDSLDVHDGRLYLTKDLDYTVSGQTVTLAEGIMTGETLTFTVLKNVPILEEEITISPSLLENGSIPLSKLQSMPTAADVGTYTKAEVDQIVANAVAAVKAEIMASLTVTSDIPMQLSVSDDGGLVITYDDGVVNA